MEAVVTNLQSMIEKHPHLRDPLELYAKWERFHREVDGILPKNGSTFLTVDPQGYPRNSAEPVLKAFSSAFSLSFEALGPLCRALEAGDIDFSRLPLDEVPAFSLPYAEEELASLLFLLSRPHFLRLREARPLDGRPWEEGRCPVCSARPALSSIAEGPQRRLHCSYCGTIGTYRYFGCPDCGNEDMPKLGTLVPEGEEGFRVATCDECRSYLKVAEGKVLSGMTPDLADLVSLPLDIVAQGKGYARRAPNPIGLRKMA